MKLFKTTEGIRNYLAETKIENKSAGFVPTMGALHQGHISLLKISKQKADITICSIFINPTQFNNKKDFENYPVTIGKDIFLLEQAGCDVLFLPQPNEIYPDGTDNLVHYNLGNQENLLEGKYRPGHFQGVCQVVHRLLDITEPDYLFLGQKDYQQCMIIKRLTELINSPAEIIIGPTLREESGLAMSSRNQRLNDKQKEQASAIYKMLLYIKNNINTTSSNYLIEYSSEYLLSHGFNKIDYVSIADAESLQPAIYPFSRQGVALIAAFTGDVRLIDNMII